MKKIGLLSIISCSASGMAVAAGVDCSVIPTCAEMGFTKSVVDCEGQTVLRCPFDLTNDNAVFCPDKLCGEEYNLEECPENGDCEECGGKQKFNGCNTGYTLSDGNVCCSDEYYNLDNKPDNATVEQCGNKYHFVGCEEGYTEENGSCVAAVCEGQPSDEGCSDYTTCLSGNTTYYICSECQEGYSLSGATCPVAICPGQKTNTGCSSYTTCLSGTTNYYSCSACSSGYVLSGTKCISAKTCAVGDVLYNNLKCYAAKPSGLTAIAVVFDASGRLAIGLTETTSIYWSSSNENVSSLTDYTTVSKAESDAKTGKANTTAIINAGLSDSSYAPGYCYSLTTGGLAKGSWFLPSLKEWKKISSNLDVIDSGIVGARGVSLEGGSSHWSSTEGGTDKAWRHRCVDANSGNYGKTRYSYKVRCGVGY